jgi:hypothetical protein
MKYFIAVVFCCVMSILSSQAQQPVNDSTISASLNELNLTAEQKLAIKKLIWDYKMEDRQRRRMLRHRIFMNLNVQQQMAIRRMWRKQLRGW